MKHYGEAIKAQVKQWFKIISLVVAIGLCALMAYERNIYAAIPWFIVTLWNVSDLMNEEIKR